MRRQFPHQPFGLTDVEGEARFSIPPLPTFHLRRSRDFSRRIDFVQLSTPPVYRSLAMTMAFPNSLIGNKRYKLESPPMYVCVCNAVTDREIRQCAELGAATLDQVRDALGVATRCGRCTDGIERILRGCDSSLRPNSIRHGSTLNGCSSPSALGVNLF
jgi:bacterioferritin-associated ferredoxin